MAKDARIQKDQLALQEQQADMVVSVVQGVLRRTSLSSEELAQVPLWIAEEFRKLGS